LLIRTVDLEMNSRR